MKKIKLNHLKMIFYVYQQLWKFNPYHILNLFLYAILDACSCLPSIVFPAIIIDSLLIQRSFPLTAKYISLYCAATFILFLLKRGFKKVNRENQTKFKNIMYQNLAVKSVSIPYSLLENSETFNLLNKAKDAISGNVNYSVRSLNGEKGLDAISFESVNILSNTIKIIITFTLLSTLHIVVAILLLGIMILNMFGGSKEKRASYMERLKTAPYRDRNQYVTNTMIRFQSAKEIRLFALQDYFINKFKDNRKEFYIARNETKSAYWFANIFSLIGDLLQVGVTYSYMIYQVISNRISLGGFTKYTSAVATLSEALKQWIQSLLNLQLYSEYLNDYKKAMDLPNEKSLNQDSSYKSLDYNTGYIVFKNVSFCYPGTNKNAINNLTLTIQKGESISLVGKNGSGKTTLIKLLLRFYQPTSGAIYLNGININSIPLDEYRKNISAIFQDFSLFNLPLIENIAPVKTENKSIEKCLNEAGLKECIEKLPNGINTYIYKGFHSDGVDLSGGEKQKCAIARMIYKDSPIMILDEPTASLDPSAEANIYENFYSISKNKTVFYISHRMASCHFCSKIIVLEQGCIEEIGTHQELINNNKLYRKMYESQSNFYNINKGLDKNEKLESKL